MPRGGEKQARPGPSPPGPCPALEQGWGKQSLWLCHRCDKSRAIHKGKRRSKLPARHPHQVALDKAQRCHLKVPGRGQPAPRGL